MLITEINGVRVFLDITARVFRAHVNDTEVTDPTLNGIFDKIIEQQIIEAARS